MVLGKITFFQLYKATSGVGVSLISGAGSHILTIQKGIENYLIHFVLYMRDYPNHYIKHNFQQ